MIESINTNTHSMDKLSTQTMRQTVIEYDYLLKDIIKYVSMPIQKGAPLGKNAEYDASLKSFIQDVNQNLILLIFSQFTKLYFK